MPAMLGIYPHAILVWLGSRDNILAPLIRRGRDSAALPQRLPRIEHHLGSFSAVPLFPSPVRLFRGSEGHLLRTADVPANIRRCSWPLKGLSRTRFRVAWFSRLRRKRCDERRQLGDGLHFQKCFEFSADSRTESINDRAQPQLQPPYSEDSSHLSVFSRQPSSFACAPT